MIKSAASIMAEIQASGHPEEWCDQPVGTTCGKPRRVDDALTAAIRAALDERRIELGMGKMDLSRRSGVGASFVRAMLSGSRTINMFGERRLCEALSCSLLLDLAGRRSRLKADGDGYTRTQAKRLLFDEISVRRLTWTEVAARASCGVATLYVIRQGEGMSNSMASRLCGALDLRIEVQCVTR